jgi:hypothetical protein
MDRQEQHELLSAYIDGELDDTGREEIDNALAADEELCEQLRQLQATRQMLRELPVCKAPDDFVHRVMARAERNHLTAHKPEEPPAQSLRWVRYVAVAAVALIAISVGMLITSQLTNPTIYTTRGETAELASNDDTEQDDTGVIVPGDPSGAGVPVSAVNLTVVASDTDLAAAEVKQALLDSGLVSLETARKAIDPDNFSASDPAGDRTRLLPSLTANVFERWEDSSAGRQFRVWVEDDTQQEEIRRKIDLLRRRQTVAQVSDWSETVEARLQPEQIRQVNALACATEKIRREQEIAGDRHAMDPADLEDKSPEERIHALIMEGLEDLEKKTEKRASASGGDPNDDAGASAMQPRSKLILITIVESQKAANPAGTGGGTHQP